jgi:hypothetical protein
MQVERNAESDPIFQKDLDLEYDPRKSDRSEACPFGKLPENGFTFFSSTFPLPNVDDENCSCMQ